jgi:hypothetical protein
MDQPLLDVHKDAIEQIAAERQDQDRRIHFLRPHRVIASARDSGRTLVSGDHLGHDSDDQHERKADAHSGKQIRQRGRQDDLPDRCKLAHMKSPRHGKHRRVQPDGPTTEINWPRQQSMKSDRAQPSPDRRRF